jgi:hypothetical protein
MPGNLTIALAIMGSTLGLYSAILSTLNAFWQWRDRRPQVRIVLRPAVRGDEAEKGLQISITAHNIGAKLVVVTGVGFVLPDKWQYWVGVAPGLGPLPFELAPASNFMVFTQPSILAKNLRDEGLAGTVKLTGFISTAAGQRFEGGRMLLNLQTGQILPGKDRTVWTLLLRG